MLSSWNIPEWSNCIHDITDDVIAPQGVMLWLYSGMGRSFPTRNWSVLYSTGWSEELGFIAYSYFESYT